MQNDLNIIKQTESTIKRYLLETFGQFLPQDKVSLINATNYVEDNFDPNMSESEMHGEITRRIMSDAISVECQKNIIFDDGSSITLDYGADLERTLVEYYSQNLSKKYGFNIDEIPELKDDLETIQLLNQKLDGKLDESVFTEDAVALLKKADFKELIEQCDAEALNQYIKKTQQLAAGLNDKTNKDTENEIMKENVDRENSVQIVWLDGKKYIKYIDKEGKVSLTEILDNGQTEEFYKTKLASLKPGEKLDPESFKRELDTYMKQIHLTKTEDVKPENLNSKQINMLNFIKSNEEIQKEAKKDVITSNDDMNIHVIESTNDIVVTKDREYSVDAHKVKDGKAQAEREGLQDTKDMSSRVLEKEEYQELIDKFTRGENLTLSELESLKRTSQYYAEQGQSVEEVMGIADVMNKDNKGPTLSPYNKKPYYGFGITDFATLIITVGAICTLILSLYLFFTSIK